jgi:hypothetical protein
MKDVRKNSKSMERVSKESGREWLQSNISKWRNLTQEVKDKYYQKANKIEEDGVTFCYSVQIKPISPNPKPKQRKRKCSMQLEPLDLTPSSSFSTTTEKLSFFAQTKENIEVFSTSIQSYISIEHRKKEKAGN